jgi:pimeloyl-ACP methyl ester carboxylesterase
MPNNHAVPAPSENSTSVRLSGRLVALLGALFPGAAAAVAEWVFFTPPRARRSRGEALLRQGIRFEVRSEGRRVVAWRFGRGPAILLVHGWAGRAAQMSAFVAPLVARGHSVVAFDAPGHGDSGRGRSSAVHFARALRVLASEAGPFHAVIAHSLGAAAVALALRDGFRARRVVFLGPAAAPPAWIRPFARRLGLPDAVVERLRSNSERRLGLPWDELDVPRLATGRVQPLLVLHDRHDDEVSVADGRAIAAAWSGARLVETEGLGHMRILRDPAVVAESVAFAAANAPEACACGAASADSCESCGLAASLFDRASRWAALAGASIATWSASSALPSTSPR